MLLPQLLLLVQLPLLPLMVSPRLLMVLLLLRLPLLLRLLSSLLLPQLLLLLFKIESLSLVLLMLVVTSTVLFPELPLEECSTLLLQTLLKLLTLPNPPLQLSRKPSTFNLPLLLPNTSSKDKRLRLVPSPSLCPLMDLVMVKPTLGCARLPHSPHLILNSELLWSKEVNKLKPNQ